MGRVGVDLYPLEIGVPLDEVTEFGRFLGGSATNVAVAAARLGRDATIITRTGQDPFGRFVHRALRELGVDDSHVTAVEGVPTPITFCEIFPPDDFPLYFYREPQAPDLLIHADELDMDMIREARVFWTTVTGLSREPSRAAQLAASEERGRRAHTVLDLDYRPMFWDDVSAARAQVERALPFATVVVGNVEECWVATGEQEPASAADALLDVGIDLVIVKRGPEGVLACTRDEIVEVPPIAVEVVNGLGAGDAFGGALCHGLLGNWPLVDTIEFANAAGAVVASRLECSTAMPTEGEVRELLPSRGASR